MPGMLGIKPTTRSRMILAYRMEIGEGEGAGAPGKLLLLLLLIFPFDRKCGHFVYRGKSLFNPLNCAGQLCGLNIMLLSPFTIGNTIFCCPPPSQFCD